jgi:hydroxymethylglutaryl-CoA synthase
MAFIVGYGAYIPLYRIKAEVIAKVWGEDVDRIVKGLGIVEKSVPYLDEDSVTLAVEAGKYALQRAQLAGEKIGAVFVGSESKVYAVKPNASIVAEALGMTPSVIGADLEFACKAGTTGLSIVDAMVDAGDVEYGMTIGSDTAQGRPGDALEYSAGAGAVAVITGPRGFAEIKYKYTFTTDTPDFWRRNGALYPSHGGRFTGEPAYFKHVLGAIHGVLERSGLSIRDFDYLALHQPNAKFPLTVAKKLGVDKAKVSSILTTPYIGNTYSASSLFTLANAFDKCEGGELILLVSFGSGAGSDAFVIEVNDSVVDVKARAPLVEQLMNEKQYVDYVTYAKYRDKIKM